MKNIKIALDEELLDDMAGFLLTTSAGASPGGDGVSEEECTKAWHVLQHETHAEFEVRVAGILFAMADKMIKQRKNPVQNVQLIAKNIFAHGFQMASAERVLTTEGPNGRERHFDMSFPG